MPVTGKTGADAIFKALHRICLVLGKYRGKLNALLVTLVATSVLTADQKARIDTFLNIAEDLCDLFKIVADHSGF